MPSTYKIESLGQKVLWENSEVKGDYPAGLAGFDEEVLVFHDSSSDYDPPKIGDELFGDPKKDKRGRWRFGRASKKNAGAAGGGGGGARRSGDEGPGLTWKSAPFERGAEHPRNEARMIHTSALSATPGFIEQMLTIGVADQPKTWDDYWKLVGKVATKLVRSYEAAMEPQQQLPVVEQEVPADTDGLAPAAAGASDDVPF